MRKLAVLIFAFLCTFAFGGTITVTSPNSGDFLGSTSQLKFNITGASVQVTVTAVITFSDSTTTTVTDKFSPDSSNKIEGTLSLSFNESTPQGAATIQVTATEPGASYNTVPPINVTIDVIAPKLVDYSPNDSQFIHGVVPIKVVVTEPNLKDIRVQINNQDIPNNTGSTTTFTVNWDTSGIQKDGNQTINIRIRDQANNETDRSVSVTLLRTTPVVTIQFPRSDTAYVSKQGMKVIVDVTSTGNGAIDVTGVDVVIKDLNNKVLLRVSRLPPTNSGNTFRWLGRIRPQISLPSSFKVVVTSVDKAGNSATPQEVIVGASRAAPVKKAG